MLELGQHFSCFGWVSDGEFCAAFKKQHERNIAGGGGGRRAAPQARPQVAAQFVVLDALEIDAAMPNAQKFCHETEYNGCGSRS
jgi:hypothetical protein